MGVAFCCAITWSILMSDSLRGLAGLGLTQEFPGIAPPIKLELSINYLNDLAPCCRGAWTAAISPQCQRCSLEASLTWTLAIVLLAVLYVGRITMWPWADRPTLTTALMIFPIYLHLREQTLAVIVANSDGSCSATYQKLKKYFPWTFN